MKSYAYCALGAAIAACMLTPAFALDVTVCQNSTYKKIQDGVNAAFPGWRVLVCAGTYAEQVTVATTGLNIQAVGVVNLIEPTPPQPYGFRVTGVNVTIQGFTISGFKDQTLAAGIMLDHAVSSSITNNVIYGNCNGVIVNQAVSPKITNNNLSQNPFPFSPQPQPGIPAPPPGQTNACVVFAFDPVTQMAIVSADGYGVKSTGGVAHQITQNQVSQNGECGIQLTGASTGANISNNTLYFNTGPQFTPCGNIDLRSAAVITVADNSIDSGTNGVMLTSSNLVNVSRNTIVRNFQGIQLVSSNRNTFTSNHTNLNTVGIFLTGQYNTFTSNDASTNDNQGIVVFADGCPDACSSRAGQGYNDTWANTFTANTIQGNGSIDVLDFSILSGTQCPMDSSCDPNPAGPPPPPPIVPPGNYTAGTLDTWVRNTCSSSSPPNICSH